MGTHSVRGRRLAPAAAALTVIAALVAGSALLAAGLHRTPAAAAPLPAARFHLTGPLADHRTQGDPVAVKVAASHVYVPSLRIDAPWTREPVTAGGLSIPADVHTVGLAAAGQPGGVVGTVLLAGHVNYVGQGAGALAELYRVAPGALVLLTDEHARVSRWVVTGLDDPLKRDVDKRIFTASGPRRLVLVTCGGAVHDGEYDRNIIVTAVPATAVSRS